ncbi:YihY/virulence factor BrkB family protein [Tersicoccus sp. Bi-70]|uniref:YihY/virulence factor BrkB family protein n=1 Tax=Tersicoccus sp. Bi-70 TaxID=1897634 RepID=UPI00097720B7|nr:YihY/virulence factor BrkB family protein [Tersicoccus sp. Bi-70]OMH36697.1 ribonuclease BN [Tersicoccus sp. Bi-70]
MTTTTSTADDAHTARGKADAPDPDDARKPDSPTEVSKPSWGYVFKRTISEFGKDKCTDLAAGLTYFAVLSLFPAILALVSILGVVGQAETTTNAVLDLLRPIGGQALDTIEPTIKELTSSTGAGFTLVIGILGALWSASGYVGGFGRAMNRIYEVDEGRPIWKLRPVMLLVTLVMVLLIAATGLMLVISGPIAQRIGEVIGLGDTAVTVWNIVKIPVMLIFVIVAIAVLYWATPNVKQPKFRWISAGAIIAIVVLIIATIGFAFYVGNFGNYNKTYGSIAGVIIFLLWIWIANISLLFGAEFDAELERGRQLQAGIKAEETIQLPPRDTKQSDKLAAKTENLVEQGRELRVESEQDGTAGAGSDGQRDSSRDHGHDAHGRAGNDGKSDKKAKKGKGSGDDETGATVVPEAVLKNQPGSHQYGTRREDV